MRLGIAVFGIFCSAINAKAQVGFLRPDIYVQPADQIVALGGTARFEVAARTAAAYQWQKNGDPIEGATTPVLHLPDVTPAHTGGYECLVSNGSASARTRTATLTVATAPIFNSHPAGATELSGTAIRLASSALGVEPISYQWRRNGQPVVGATDSTLTVSLAPENTGTYDVVASNGYGRVASRPARLTIGPDCVLSNLSVRASLRTGQTLIAGFVSNGTRMNTAPDALLLRAVGPSLDRFGLLGPSSVEFELFDSGNPLGVTSGWRHELGTVFAEVGAFALPAASQDAAALISLHSASAVVYGTHVDGRVVLVELYDTATKSVPRLINMSARAQVRRTPDDYAPVIAGFALKGTGAKRLLIRGVGPHLGEFRVLSAATDPLLAIYDASGILLTENDDWDADLAPLFQTVGAFPLHKGSRDSALVVTLPAGSTYTAQVSGTVGEVLVEVYELADE